MKNIFKNYENYLLKLWKWFFEIIKNIFKNYENDLLKLWKCHKVTIEYKLKI